MDSRIKMLENHIHGLNVQRKTLDNEHEIICEQNKQLLNYFEKLQQNNLNNNKTTHIKR